MPHEIPVLTVPLLEPLAPPLELLLDTPLELPLTPPLELLLDTPLELPAAPELLEPLALPLLLPVETIEPSGSSTPVPPSGRVTTVPPPPDAVPVALPPELVPTPLRMPESSSARPPHANPAMLAEAASVSRILTERAFDDFMIPESSSFAFAVMCG